MSVPVISTIGPFPSRESAAADFDVQIDAAYDDVEALPGELNTMIAWISDTAGDVNANAAAALTAADEASAAAIAAASEASAWVSGGSYTLGEIRWSPVNYATYRAKTTHSGLTTDPSADTTNWTLGNLFTVGSDPIFTGVTSVEATAEETATLTGATPTLDKSAANDFSLTTTANTTIAVSNTPSGKAWVATILITMGGAHTLAVTGADWGDEGVPGDLATGDMIEITLRGVGSTFRASETWRKTA